MKNALATLPNKNVDNLSMADMFKKITLGTYSALTKP